MKDLLAENSYPEWAHGMARDALEVAAKMPAEAANRLAAVIWFVYGHGAARTLEGIALSLEEDYAVLGAGLGLPKSKDSPITLAQLLAWLRALSADMSGALPQAVQVIPEEMLVLEEDEGARALQRVLATGLRQSQVVAMTGISQPTISKASRGKQKLCRRDVARLRKAFPEAFTGESP